jgi:hypothetical protein
MRERRSEARADDARATHDHFVTLALWTSLWSTQVIHDQFVTRIAITLSRVRPQTRDHFVTHSYS